MLDKAPYRSELLDKVLHTKLQTIPGMRYSRDDIAFKSVALVGMLLPDVEYIEKGIVTDQDFYSEDLYMLGRSFNALSKGGIPLHPEAVFQIYNILPPVSSDYLLAALDYEEIDFPQNDLTILQYLPKYGLTPRDQFYNASSGFKNYCMDELHGDRTWPKYLSVSHMHREFQIWPEAANKLGAKMVITHGGVDDEVTTEEFEGHPIYRTLIDSDDNQRQKKQSGRNNMGAVVHKDMIDTYKSHAEHESEIGKALHALVP